MEEIYRKHNLKQAAMGKLALQVLQDVETEIKVPRTMLLEVSAT